MYGIEEQQPRSRPDFLASERIDADSKTFFFDYGENSRGRFLRITESTSRRRDSIVIPAERLEEFVAAIGRVIESDRVG